METPSNDAKTEIVPSTTQDASAAPSTAANGDTTTPPVATPAATEPKYEDNDAIIDAVLAKTSEADPATAKAEKPPTDKSKETPAAKEEPGKAPVDKTKEKEPEIPTRYDKDPAWIRMRDRTKAAEEKAAAVQKDAEIYQGNKAWLQERGIAPDEHVAAMEAYAQVRAIGVAPEHVREVLQWRTLVETDPAKAYEIAAPIV